MPDTSFFAVFDGHGGDLVAMMSKDKLLPAIHRTDAFQAGSQVSTVAEVATDSDYSFPDQTPQQLAEALKDGLFELDRELRQHPQFGC